MAIRFSGFTRLRSSISSLFKSKKKQRRQKLFAEAAEFYECLRKGDDNTASSKLRKFRELGISDLSLALEERLGAEIRAAAANIPMDARPKLYWADGPFPGNVGDSFNPWLIEKLTGSPAVRANPAQDVLLAAGSIARLSKAGSYVWGSGFMSRKDIVPAGVSWKAVRGPVSRAMVLDSGQDCPAVFGDPALLTPLIYHPKQLGGCGVGLILHYSHLKFLRPGDILVISPLRCGEGGAKSFIDEICRHDYIFSTSLHGLIFANAYGIPARWCKFNGKSKRLSGDDMKFADYFLGAGLPPHEPACLSKLPDFDRKRFEPLKLSQPALKFDAGALLDAFPWPPGIQIDRTSLTKHAVDA